MTDATRWPRNPGHYAALATGMALAIPTLLSHYPPMSDLPVHEALIGVLRHYGDPAYFPPRLYEIDLGHTNQLFHIVSWALSYVLGTRWAVKIVVALTQIAILLTGARLADHVGRSRWAVVLLAPLALGYTYYWGLVANMIGFAALFGALPTIDRAYLAPTARSMAKVCAVFLFLFWAHESVLFMAIAFAGMLAVIRPMDRRLTALRAVPVVLAVAGVVTDHVLMRRTFGHLQLRMADTYPPLRERVAAVPNVLFGAHDWPIRLTLLALALAGVVFLLVARIRSREPRPPPAPRRMRRVLDVLIHYRFELTGAAFLFGFTIAPSTWNSATLLYTRLAGPAWALFAITAAPRLDPPRLTKLLIAVLPVAVLLVAWPQFADADQAYRDLDSLISLIPKNSSILVCNVDQGLYRTRVFSASPGPARALADRGGRISFNILSSPIAPAHIRREYRWNEYDERKNLGAHLVRPAHDLRRFGYVIAESRDASSRDLLALAFKPDAERVAESGEWVLFKSTHEPPPFTSPEAPMDPSLPSLRDRMAMAFMMQRYGQERVSP
jgi:hypothetical protein